MLILLKKGGINLHINDKVFGKLEYDYIWSKDMEVVFLEQKIVINLMVNGDEDGEFEEEQYCAYNFLMQKWDNLQEELLKRILNYYNSIRHELGYDIEVNKDYPFIGTTKELRQYITLTGIVIPYQGAYDGRECGIVFDCEWDSENGIGICLIDEEITEIGEQDIVM